MTDTLRPTLPLSSVSFLQSLSDDDSIEIPQFHYNYDSDEDAPEGDHSPATTIEPVTAHVGVSLGVPPSTGSLLTKTYRPSLERPSLERSSTDPPPALRPISPLPTSTSTTSSLAQRAKAGVNLVATSRHWRRSEAPEPLPLDVYAARTTSGLRRSLETDDMDEAKPTENASSTSHRTSTSQPHESQTPHQTSQRGFLSASFRSARAPRLLGGRAQRVPATELPPLEDEEGSSRASPPVQDPTPLPRRSSGERSPSHSPSEFTPSPPLPHPSRAALPTHPLPRSRASADQYLSADSPPSLVGNSRSPSYEPEPPPSYEVHWQSRTSPPIVSSLQSAESLASLRSRPASALDSRSRRISPDGLSAVTDPSRRGHTPSPEMRASSSYANSYHPQQPAASHLRHESAPPPRSYHRRATQSDQSADTPLEISPTDTDKENPAPQHRPWKLGYSPPPLTLTTAKTPRDDFGKRRVEIEQLREHGPALQEIGNNMSVRTLSGTTATTKAGRRPSTAQPVSTVSLHAGTTATIRASHMAAGQAVSPEPMTLVAPTPSAPATYHVSHEEMPGTSNGKTRPTFWVNKVAYTRLDVLGRGGSSKVYRVLSQESKIYALKKVTLDRADDDTMSSYMNEIALLRRLEGNDRIIKLIDSEASRKKGSLILVLECGEIDMAKLLEERRGQRLQFQWVETYWQQMLEAVQVIHEAAIVHSDLKPANFVLVRGSLKLIDFGIAKAIPNDTTNIQRDAQIGSVNYMSPEAIEDTNQHTREGKRCMKLGRPSDVWSLGCILYQMIYGAPPFYHLSTFQKMRAIPDPHHVIDFPPVAVPTVRGERGLVEVKSSEAVAIPDQVLDILRSCLQRQPKARRTIPEILASPWLTTWQSSSTSDSAASALTVSRGIHLQPDEFVMTTAYLEEILRTSCRFGAEHGMCSDDTIRQWRARIVSNLTDDRTA